jgi:Ca2+-binding EF-hand superfamily protein
MLLAGWIDLFNEQINKNYTPIDNLFAEYDSGQEGNMGFDDFAKMNEASGVNMNRKDLHRIFDLIDRQKNGLVRLDDIRRLSSYSLNQEDSSQDQN